MVQVHLRPQFIGKYKFQVLYLLNKKNLIFWAVSSMAERSLDVRKVIGSSPIPPTAEERKEKKGSMLD